MRKYRSLDPQYVRWIIKEYEHWTLLLHEDQRYLGRAYFWLVRPGEMQRLSDLNQEEREELFCAMREYETALRALWQPDHMNYAWLGNLIKEHGGHGHMHMIPRYETQRMFDEVVYVDENWGQNYTPSKPFPLINHDLVNIRQKLRAHMM